MTKADIVECIHATTGISQKESYDLFEAVISVITGIDASALIDAENNVYICHDSIETLIDFI